MFKSETLTRLLALIKFNHNLGFDLGFIPGQNIDYRFKARTRPRFSVMKHRARLTFWS